VIDDGSGDSSAASQQPQSSQLCVPGPTASQHSEPLVSLESEVEQQPEQQFSASTVASAAACGTANPQVQAESIGCKPPMTAIATRATHFCIRRWRVERRMEKRLSGVETYREDIGSTPYFRKGSEGDAIESLDAGCWMLDAGCWMLDGRHGFSYSGIQDRGSSIQHLVSRIPYPKGDLLPCQFHPLTRS
jgi:hypothetical protein